MKTREKDLREKLASAQTVDDKVSAYFWLTWYLLTGGEMGGFKSTLDEFKAYAYRQHNQHGIGLSLVQEGLSYIFIGDVQSGFNLFKEALVIFETTNDRYGLGITYGRLGSAYWSFGDHQKAFDYTLKSIEICEEQGIYLAKGWSCYLLAGYYFDLKEYQSAQKYFADGLDIFTKYDEVTGVARCINGLADVFLKTGDHDNALEYNFKAYELIKDDERNVTSLSRVYNDFGRIYRNLGQQQEALNYYQKSLEIRTEMNYVQGLITTYSEISELYMDMGQIDIAISSLKRAEELAVPAKAKAKLIAIHRLFVAVYKQANDPWTALKHYDIFETMREEVMGDENTMKINNFKILHESERSKQETEIYRLRNIELKAAYDEIEQKNRDITASITYAKRIQTAVLPPREDFNQIIPEGFIFFRPKDIVSGDFYWFYEEGEQVIVALADCTGHGVPGAFMTMMGNDMLNDIIVERNVFSPAQILALLDRRLRETLKQNSADSAMHDTIDISIVAIDKNQRSIAYAGARQSMHFFHKSELLKIRGSKFHVGGDQHNQEKDFEEHQFKYELNDVIYLNSDGYPDQFHGTTKEKFKSRRLTSLYREIHAEAIKEQESTLADALDSWKQEGKQTDDILVIGVRLCEQFNPSKQPKNKIFA